MLPRLKRYALSFAYNASEADDLLQSSVVRALTRWQQLSDMKYMDRWMFTVMSSVWKNELRAKSIRLGKGFQSPDALQDPAFINNLDGSILYSEVLQMIGELPESQREVIMLVYVEGFKYEEAADILEVPVGTIMSRIARARVKLASKLGSKKSQSFKEV